MLEVKHFVESDMERINALIRNNPLGIVIVHTDLGLDAHHLPMLSVDSASGSQLQAHIPRNNALSNLASAKQDCLVIFQGADGYISPSWYATKKEHGKVVPTWNYLVVHMKGKLTIVDDSDWVLNQINGLTELQEQQHEAPWAVDDAPQKYVSAQLKALVGVQIDVTDIQAKSKASQNQPKQNQASVLDALARRPESAGLYDEMQKIIGSTS
ncbi:MAG: FMN-binding negative transcriptional regulator [Pseudomonadota bacterium]